MACSQGQILAGVCVSGGLGEGEAILEGSGGTGGSGGNGNGDGGGGAADAVENCDAFAPDGSCLVTITSPTTGPVTLADIAAFRPDGPVDNMEPNGWMVVGLDTNFFAGSGGGVKDGTLLGQPASVRFTAVGWRWNYGDGGAAALGTPGARWADQGIPEFDPTPTSHVYRAAGTYVINLVVAYRAEYRFAGMPWAPIAGLLTVPAPPLTAAAGDAKTVLVERECTGNPAGPGC